MEGELLQDNMIWNYPGTCVCVTSIDMVTSLISYSGAFQEMIPRDSWFVFCAELHFHALYSLYFVRIFSNSAHPVVALNSRRYFYLHHPEPSPPSSVSVAPHCSIEQTENVFGSVCDPSWWCRAPSDGAQKLISISHEYRRCVCVYV